MQIEHIQNQAIELLQQLISTPSLSREEDKTADIIFDFLSKKNLNPNRHLNNIWAVKKSDNPHAKTILLNSHHDTVKAANGWDTNPFEAVLKNDTLFGLGSNDAGASAVSLLATFCHLSQYSLKYNLIVAITAEEEVSGANGIRSLLPLLGDIDLGIVGEPTGMNLAIAEKGLIVLDCTAHGKTGHAARDEGENALYKALDDLNWFRNFEFEKNSPTLGKVKMTATQINCGKQHNVVPDQCNYVVDIRTTDQYNNLEVIDIIKQNIQSEINPRSYHLNSSKIDINHPLVHKGKKMGKTTYGSPTLSDQSVMNFETIKIGPGDSARSHTPNEFIHLSEIKNGISDYITLLKEFEF